MSQEHVLIEENPKSTDNMEILGENIIETVIERHPEELFALYLQDFPEEQDANHVVKDFEWSEEIQWKNIRLYPSEFKRCLIFRNCVFTSRFWITSCEFEGLHITFENCHFHGAWQGGNRQGGGNQASLYDALTFKGCIFSETVNLSDSVLPLLHIEGCTFKDLLYLRRSQVSDGTLLNNKCTEISACEMKLATSFYIKGEDSTCHVLDLSGAKELTQRRESRYAKPPTAPPKESTDSKPNKLLLQECSCTHLKLDQADLPQTNVIIKNARLQDLSAGNAPRQSSNYAATLSMLQVEGTSLQHLWLGRSRILQSLSMDHIRDLQTVFAESLEVQGDFHFQSCESKPTLNFQKTQYHGSVNWSGLELGELNMSKAIFMKKANFEDNQFKQKAHFSETHFLATSHWRGSVFHQEALFPSATFEKQAVFGYWGKKVSFRDLACFQGATFARAQFAVCEFLGTALFESACFRKLQGQSKHDFGKSKFRGSADFQNITVLGDLSFSSDSAQQEGRTTFEDTFVLTLHENSGKQGNQGYIHIRLENALYKHSATFQGAGHRLRLHLRRSHLHNATIRGYFSAVYLQKTQITTDSRIPLFDEWRHGNIRLHDAHVHNTSFSFASNFRTKNSDAIDLFARDATLKNVTFTGSFVGNWRMLSCKLSSVQFQDININGDMNLSGSLIKQTEGCDSFSAIQFSKENTKKYKGDRVPKLQLSQCEHLENIKFTNGCEIFDLDLRGSIIQGLEMREGQVCRLLLRQGLRDRTLIFRIHPSAKERFRTLFQLSPEFSSHHSALLDWIGREIKKELKSEEQHNIPQIIVLDDETAIAQAEQEPPPRTSSSRAVNLGTNTTQESSPRTTVLENSQQNDAVQTDNPHKEQEQADKQWFSAPMKEERAPRWKPFPSRGAPVSPSTKNAFELIVANRQFHKEAEASPQDFNFMRETNTPSQLSEQERRETLQASSYEEESDVFFVGLWRELEKRGGEREDDMESKESDAQQEDWIELDLSRHHNSPFKYIKRELERHYRSTTVHDWRLHDFVVKDSDQNTNPDACPVFFGIQMEGSTVGKKLLESIISEGPFSASQVCSFNQASFRGSEFKGTVTIKNSTIQGFLNVDSAVFHSELVIANVHCRKAGIQDPAPLSSNDLMPVVGSFDSSSPETKLYAPKDGELYFARSKFRGPVYFFRNKIEKSWNFLEAEFDGPVLFESERNSGDLQCEKTEFNHTLQLRHSKFKGEINFTSAFFAHECFLKGVKAGSIYAGKHERVTQFKGPLSLRDIKLKSSLFLGHARLASTFTMESVEVKQAAILLGCEFGSDALLQRITGEPRLVIFRSSFGGRLLIEETHGLRTMFLGRSLINGSLIVRGTITPQDDVGVEDLQTRSIQWLSLSGVNCTGKVSLENLGVEQEIYFHETIFNNDTMLYNLKFYGSSPVCNHRQTVDINGIIKFEHVDFHSQLTLRELHRCVVLFEHSRIRKDLDIQSFTKTLPLHCSLSDAEVTNIAFPQEAVDALGFVQPLQRASRLDDTEKPYFYQQKAQHYAQLYQISIKRKQFREAKEFRYQYRTALKAMRFGDRFRYLRDVRSGEEEPTTSKLKPSSQHSIHASSRLTSSSPKKETTHQENKIVKAFKALPALWGTLRIGFGWIYDGYGKKPWYIFLWLLLLSTLSIPMYRVLHPSWGINTLAIAWLDTLLTPVGLVLQGIGVAPLGTKFYDFPSKTFFVVHTFLISVLLINFLALLIPGLISRDNLSQMLSRRTGGTLSNK